MKDFIKAFELGKEFDLKHSEFLPLIQGLGFNIKGFSANISLEVADEIRAAIKASYIKADLDAKEAAEGSKLAAKAVKDAEDARAKEFKEANRATMIGTYYCPLKRRYFIIETKINPEDLDLQGKGYGSVYNLNHDFNLKLGRSGILKPAKLADGKKWAGYGEKK